ncbi:MAG: hypothetical protein OXD46_08460 [Chloroflexi bacterium]|nr:hypothetical protein [Chloroflexota bacterium]
MLRLLIYTAAFGYMAAMCQRPVELDRPLSMHWPQVTVLAALLIGEVVDWWVKRGKERKVYKRRLVAYVVGAWLTASLATGAYWYGDTMWYVWLVLGAGLLGVVEWVVWLKAKVQGRKGTAEGEDSSRSAVERPEPPKHK